jgi:hypothetical protein
VRNLNWLAIFAVAMGFTGVVVASVARNVELIVLSTGLFSITIAILVVADNRSVPPER